SGTTSAASSPFGLSVDTHAPNAPLITALSPDTGTAGDGITTANVLTLNGTGEANSTVRVYDGTILLGSADVDLNGNWTFQTDTLTTGAHSFAAKDQDWAGNTSAASAAKTVTIVSAPPAPAISAIAPDSNIAADGTKVLTVTGTAAANSTV